VTIPNIKFNEEILGGTRADIYGMTEERRI